MHNQLAAPSFAGLTRLLGRTTAVACVATAKLAVASKRFVLTTPAVLHAIQPTRPRWSARGRWARIGAGWWRRHDTVSWWHVAFAAVNGVAHVLVAPLRQAKATTAESAQAHLHRNQGGREWRLPSRSVLHMAYEVSLDSLDQAHTRSIAPDRMSIHCSQRDIVYLPRCMSWRTRVAMEQLDAACEAPYVRGTGTLTKEVPRGRERGASPPHASSG